MMKKITKDDYLKLAGLLSLAPRHNQALVDIEAAVCSITGDEPNSGSHSGDAVYNDYTADELLKKLEIEVDTE
jgi:hypothetical protein